MRPAEPDSEQDVFQLSKDELDDPRDKWRRPKRRDTELPTKTVAATPIGSTESRNPKLDRPEIRKVRERIAQWLSIPEEDTDVIDFILAVFKSHELPGDPLWAIIIDASGGGKTELLRAFHKLKQAYFLSKLTEKTLVSGYRDPKQPKKDPSLLPQLDEKVLVIKDLAPLLSMRRESRNAIIGDLRGAYDGFTDQGRGNIGKVEYKSRFSVIAASTLAIERVDAVDQELGERFIKFRARGTATLDKVRKAIGNVGADNSMRSDIEEAISNYIGSLPRIRSTEIPESLRERLIELADFTAKARSNVARDRSGVIQYIPRPEVGTRLGKELGKLLLALAAVRRKKEPDEQDFATVQRVAEDCLPPNRLAIVNAIRGSAEPLETADIAELTGLPRSTAGRTLEDLRVLGLINEVEKAGEASAWTLAND